MAASAVQNPAAPVDSKSAKKKKAKAGRTESPAPTASSEKAVSVAPNDANGDDSEPGYLRELSKNIRNVNKKLTNASKTDGLIAEHKDKSLDQLVAQKIINADQKAQVLKKPSLQAQLSQLEEQYSQFKKLDSDYRQRLVAEKAEVTKTLTDKFEKEKADAVREVSESSAAAAKKTLHDSLLTLSQFLRLAAARRADDQNQQQDENLALEGVLLQVYSGDENGVATMLKLVQGSEETTKGVANESLQTTFAQVKAAAAANAGALFQSEASEEPATEAAPAQVQSDPTLIHASLTEIDEGTDTPLAQAAALTNGHSEEADAAPAAPANAGVGDDAANAVAESHWDANNNKDLSMSQEWVQVPRDLAETETGITATTAATGNTQSWADEQPDHPPPAAAPAAAIPNATTGAAANAAADDGFHQVQRHNRGRNDREGFRGGRGNGFRGGRGRGGDGRGRGRSGRGRGGPGGENGGNGNFHRGPRRNEES